MKRLRACNGHVPGNGFSMAPGVAMTGTSIRLHQDECLETATWLIVTHNIQQAVCEAEKTGFFLNGRMVEFDSIHKVLINPSDKRSEDYITGRFG